MQLDWVLVLVSLVTLKLWASLQAGDYMGAIETAGTEMLVGTGIEMGVRALGPSAMAAAAPVLKGAGL